MSKDTVTAIDKAIAAAKARQAAKAGMKGSTPEAGKGKGSKAPKEPKAPKTPKVTDEEKAAKKATRDAERLAKKAVRDAARSEKKAAKELERASKKAHMSKVDKAAGKLPSLYAEAQEAFDNITCNFGAGQIAAIAAHLTHFNRAKATERALSQKLAEGDVVRIVSGDTRYIGQVGNVTKAQRIRCFVELEGVNKPVYLFTSDVEVIESASDAPVAEVAAG